MMSTREKKTRTRAVRIRGADSLGFVDACIGFAVLARAVGVNAQSPFNSKAALTTALAANSCLGSDATGAGCKDSNNVAIASWDVSGVDDMEYVFKGKSDFNADISNWDVSSVTNMNAMFQHASSFNQDLSKWNVQKVTSMGLMFNGAPSFNKDISSWNTAAVTDWGGMFSGATAWLASFHRVDGTSSVDGPPSAWSPRASSDEFCSSTFCTSPNGSGGYDCWAGSRTEPCTCSAGAAKETGESMQHMGQTYYLYTCCTDGSGTGEQCGTFSGDTCSSSGSINVSSSCSEYNCFDGAHIVGADISCDTGFSEAQCAEKCCSQHNCNGFDYSAIDHGWGAGRCCTSYVSRIEGAFEHNGGTYRSCEKNSVTCEPDDTEDDDVGKLVGVVIILCVVITAIVITSCYCARCGCFAYRRMQFIGPVATRPQPPPQVVFVQQAQTPRQPTSFAPAPQAPPSAVESYPPSLVLIEGDKISKESHLENYMRCIEAGWAPEDARGRYLGKNYPSLARLKKYDSNPYEKDDPRFKRKDGEGHLHEAWRHLKDHWDVLPTPSHESSLRAFWKKLNLLKTSGFSGDKFSLRDPEPFDKAIGGYGTSRWIKLKEIVDEDLHFPEDAEAERALKDGWTHAG
jgi:surface protein